MISVACLVAAALLVLCHLVDLYTTSEILKKGKGSEANPLLGWALNSPRLSEDAKFWILAAVKTLVAGLAVYFAWNDPSIWFLAGEVVVLVVYAVVLRRNWAIYKR